MTLGDFRFITKDLDDDMEIRLADQSNSDILEPFDVDGLAITFNEKTESKYIVLM